MKGPISTLRGLDRKGHSEGIFHDDLDQRHSRVAPTVILLTVGITGQDLH
jgi:hypothetical protein